MTPLGIGRCISTAQLGMQMGKLSNMNASQRTMAEQADRHELYQQAVQDPDTEIELLTEKFSELRGRPPLALREDFCGTAYLAVEWCKSDPRRTAIGVDLDAETIAWGREHNLVPAGNEVANQIELIENDVLDAETQPVDLICAFNFSYNGFKQRKDLIGYLRAVRRALRPDGMLVMDVYGGSEAMDVLEEDRELDDSDISYVWEQAKFNPINHHTVCHIHFDFPDGSRLDKAFTYHWRLWTLPELQDALAEAGFSKVHVYWEEFEDTDEDDEYLQSTGRYTEAREVENQESWIAYVFAEV